MNLAVLIAAGGGSSRFNHEGASPSDAPRSKLNEDLGGKPVLQRTIELFTKLDHVHTVIVAGPGEPAVFEQFKLRHGDKLGLWGVKLCPGGKNHRWESVREALKLVPGDATHIAVHDAARPCTPPELIERLIDAAATYPAVVPGLEVTDTLKKTTELARPAADVDPLTRILGDDGESAGAGRRGSVRVSAGTVDRATLYAMQTPQIFAADVLRRAYTQADLSSTDDAGLVERLLAAEDHPEPRVVVIDGDVRNIKITRPADVRFARTILGVGGPHEKPAHLRF